MTVKDGSPLVSVTIPTYNSASTLAATLAAVASQTYKNVEIIVVDSHSGDGTTMIAAQYAARVIQIHGKLLKARQEGTLAAKGAFVLLLDSDQILEPTALERAVQQAQEGPYDLLFLEEHSYKPHHWLQRLFELDRRFIHQSAVMDPQIGVMLPRFFRREVLFAAFAAMPVDELTEVVAQDHAIIHWEVSKISRQGAVLPNAVYHMDPDDVMYLIKHFYSKGQAARKLERNQAYSARYKEMFDAKSRSRGIGLGRSATSFESNLVLLLKGAPYMVGKWFG